MPKQLLSAKNIMRRTPAQGQHRAKPLFPAWYTGLRLALCLLAFLPATSFAGTMQNRQAEVELPPPATIVAPPENEPLHYWWETPFTMRNRNITQPDGSSKYLLTLHASDARMPETAPEVYYIVEPNRRSGRHGRGTAQAPIPKVYAATVKMHNGHWVAEAIAGGQARMDVQAKIRHAGKNYYAMLTLPVWSPASPDFVPPPEAVLPEGWPQLRVHSPAGEFFYRTETPLIISLQPKGHMLQGPLLLADSLREEKMGLAFANNAPQNGQHSMLFTAPDDDRLNSSGQYSKHMAWIAGFYGGGGITLTTEINRNSQTHSHRAAGFITAGAAFALALCLALSMRLRFREPNKRGKVMAHAH